MAKKILKIAVLTEIINFHSGARAPLEIGRHLAKLGHQVTIYAFFDRLNENTLKDLQKTKNLRIKIIYKKSFPFVGKYFVIPDLYKCLKRNQTQVIYFSGTLPFFLGAYITRIPIIWMYQGTQFDAYLEQYLPRKITLFQKIINKLINLYIYLVSIIIYRFANKIVAVSHFAAYEGNKLFKRQATSVIYNGTTIFPSLKKISHSKVEIISVSRITPYKGFDIIIKALLTLNTKIPFRFTIIGSQPKTKYLQYLKKFNQKNMRIIIDPSDKVLNRLYQKADIYTTADKYLFFGMPITEAAQFKIPALSFNYGAIKELVTHNKTGIITNTFESFTFNLKKLIENQKLRITLGKNAQKKLKSFSWTSSAKKWEKILLSLAKYN